MVLLVPSAIFAQERIILGSITDKNNLPLPDVKVWSPSDTFTVYSDFLGIFRIRTHSKIDSLFFYKKGFIPGRIATGGKTELAIQLRTDEVYKLSFEELLKTKVSTVSLLEQDLTDAPGVVTVITHEDLRRMGIRTIKEALTLVPGYSLMQNDDEQIFSVRGIFATTNQKILVMRDGHSLNEANLDIPQIEYSLSIENIEKIEVIRGSGASIYGNSALASVVNIITRNDDNSEAKISAGTYGQFDLDFYSRNNLSENISLLLYGRYANVGGQHFSVIYPYNNQNIKGTYVTGNYPDNYDIGFKLQTQKLTLSFSTRRHEYKTYWTARGNYLNVDSLLASPGLLMNSVHLNLAYETKLKENLKLNFVHFLDNGQLDNTRVLSPPDPIKYTHGRIQMNEWNASKIGANYYFQWGYSQKGQMLGGISLEQRRYANSWLASNTTDSSKIVFSSKPFYPPGHEVRGAFYLQAQHKLLDWLSLDAGLRYDFAQKFKSSLNPRLALIASKHKMITAKLMYTEAFQAPGYSYRTSNADYSGSIGELEPEKLTTLQASFRYNNRISSYFEFTAFYNRLSNLITRVDNNYYTNFGKLATYGLEFDMKQDLKPIMVFFNYSLLLPDTSNTDFGFIAKNIYKNRFRYFPTNTANAGVFYSLKQLVEISLYGQIATGFKSMPNQSVGPRMILNTCITVNSTKSAKVSLSAYNLLDKVYKLGDPSVMPLQQQGRWILCSFIYNIKSDQLLK
jgi:outer membrane receptor for ferrienterochelin and colicins